MRAVCSKDENTTALWEAHARWRFMLEGMSDCKEQLNWRDIFTRAVKSFRETDHKGDEVEVAHVALHRRHGSSAEYPPSLELR